MEKEYQDIKKKEQEEMVELRRLRSENRLLKKRNELLEAESAELADKLVRGQVSRAEEEETSFAIQTELSQLRRNFLEVSHQLENAHEEIRALSLRLQENVSILISSEIYLNRQFLTKTFFYLCYEFFYSTKNINVGVVSNPVLCFA